MSLTNSNNAFGAALITNPDVMDYVREVIGEDYYIAPSSIHEDDPCAEKHGR